MKKLVLLVAIMTLMSCHRSHKESVAYFHIWKLDGVYDEPITDIRRWAADNFRDGPHGDQEYLNVEMFDIDINHDGIPETFVTCPSLHGTGGGPHLVFQKRDNSHFYIGQLGGRRRTMRVLPIGSDGLLRIMTSWHNGGGSSTAAIWKNDGQRFILVSSEEIHSGDSGTVEGRKRWKELFGR